MPKTCSTPSAPSRSIRYSPIVAPCRRRSLRFHSAWGFGYALVSLGVDVPDIVASQAGFGFKKKDSP